MNLFYLDECLKKNAEYHVDRHTVKMILESAQLACSAHWFHGGEAPYRKTHINHPTSIWTRCSLTNYLWCVDYGLSLCEEYTYRYGKVHKTESVLKWLRKTLPPIQDKGFTPFALAMPDEYKLDCPIKSYRNYYREDKSHLFSWTKREKPEWI